MSGATAGAPQNINILTDAAEVKTIYTGWQQPSERLARYVGLRRRYLARAKQHSFPPLSARRWPGAYMAVGITVLKVLATGIPVDLTGLWRNIGLQSEQSAKEKAHTCTTVLA